MATNETINSYKQATLWIAYGLSILFSTFAAIAGIVAIILSGASTIVRVAKQSHLDVDEVDQKSDGFGRDPLPEYLEHARLTLWGRRGNVDDDQSRTHDGSKDTSTQEVVEAQSTEGDRLVVGTGDHDAACREESVG